MRIIPLLNELMNIWWRDSTKIDQSQYLFQRVKIKEQRRKRQSFESGLLRHIPHTWRTKHVEGEWFVAYMLRELVTTLLSKKKPWTLRGANDFHTFLLGKEPGFGGFDRPWKKDETKRCHQIPKTKFSYRVYLDGFITSNKKVSSPTLHL